MSTIEKPKRGRRATGRNLTEQLHILVDASILEKLLLITERDGHNNTSATVRRLILDEFQRRKQQ